MIQDRRSRKVAVVPDVIVNGPTTALRQRLIDEEYGLLQMPDVSVLTARAASRYVAYLVDQVEEYYRNQHEVILVRPRGHGDLGLERVQREAQRRGVRWTRTVEF